MPYYDEERDGPTDEMEEEYDEADDAFDEIEEEDD